MELIVLAKEPVPGRVKTRLCPPCQPSQAAALAAAALADTLAAAVASRARRVILALDGQPGPWLPAGVDVVDQGGGSLGERLARAWSHSRGPVLQIGMDTPQVTPRMLDAAFTTLARPGVDAALGLAVDGGWWALAARRPDPRLFDGVPMSTRDTGALQRARLEALGLRVAPLPVQRDVDRFEDAVAVARVARHTRFAWTLATLAVGA